MWRARRALYLSVKDKRPFLHRDNWRNPWQGWMQTSVQRVVSSGLYFALQGIICDFVLAHPVAEGLSPTARALGVGLLAGSLNGALLNPIAAIKYHQWGLGTASTWRGAVRHAWSGGGFAPFLKGISATMTRDTVFGGCYEVTRRHAVTLLPAHSSDARWQFLVNMSSAALATVLSSPFNYVRSMQYATPPNQTPHRAWPQLLRLWANARTQPRPLVYVRQRLRVGWGTARVAVGMAMAQYVFSRFRND